MPVLFSPGVTEISSQLVPFEVSENRLLLEDSEVQFWTFIPPPLCHAFIYQLPAGPQAKLLFSTTIPSYLG